jgi:hypothetical protein
MTQDEEHLKLLGIFHFVVGGLTALFACIPLIHVGLGVAMLSGALGGGKGPPPPPLLGWLFLVIGATFVLSGWALAIAILIAGRKLRRRQSRLYCLVVAGLECMFMPFGTVLGVFTLIVLTRELAKELFMARPCPGLPG